MRRGLGAFAGYVRRHHIGLLALVVALSGTAYAASKIESSDIAKKAVKSKHIAKNAVKAKHVKDGTVGAAEVADNSLTGADIDEASLQVTRVSARIRDGNDRTVPRTPGPPPTFTHGLGQIGPWTQRADEVNDFSGEVLVRFPAGCVPAGPPPGTRLVTIQFVRPGSAPGSGVVAFATALDQGGAGERTVVAPFGGFILPTPDAGKFEPGADTTRVLDVHAAASCDPASTADPAIDEIRVDVIGHR